MNGILPNLAPLVAALERVATIQELLLHQRTEVEARIDRLLRLVEPLIEDQTRGHAGGAGHPLE